VAALLEVVLLPVAPPQAARRKKQTVMKITGSRFNMAQVFLSCSLPSSKLWLRWCSSQLKARFLPPK
jgi:hypothetical protein